MKKEKIYCPKKQGTFRMMFGFGRPYAYPRRKKHSGIKEVSIDLKNVGKL